MDVEIEEGEEGAKDDDSLIDYSDDEKEELKGV